MEIKKKQSTRKRSTARWIVVLLLLAVFLFSLYQTLRILYGYRQAKAVYENAERAYLIPVSRDETEAETERIPPAIDFEALQAVNKDVIGWIFIEGTEVNYPILLGVNNQQYLFQSYEKKYTVAGSIFLDYRCGADFEDARTVIYGHNMKNGMMFGKLDRYQKADYLAEHPYVYILLAEGGWKKYRVLDCGQAAIDGETYDLPRSTEDADADRLLTLSTCTNDSRDDVRFVVNCVLEEVGTQNPDH